MIKASAIGKEWHQQAEALEAWMTGKTIEEIMNLPVGEDGKTTEADVMTSCTIGVSDFWLLWKKPRSRCSRLLTQQRCTVPVNPN
ncbi:MAG: hypothetical protein ACLSA6_00720 [Holdemania massiliensis]